MAGRLVCAACGASHDSDERFCRDCGMPLVRDEALGPVSERQERARKVSPQYGEGRLVKVAYARNSSEAEMIAGMLLEEGIPSVIRRSGGFDVPDFLAAGPRDILVAESGVDHARELLGDQRSPGAEPRSRLRETPAWVRGLALLLVVVLVGLVAAGVVAAFLD